MGLDTEFAPPHPATYLRGKGELVELHHLVHVLCGRKGVIARHPEGWTPSTGWPPLLPASMGLTVVAPGHQDVLKATVGLVHAELCAAGRDGG